MKAKFLLVATILTLLLISSSALGGGARFIGNKRSKKLHDTTHSGDGYSCQAYIGKMAKRNKKYFKTEKQANKAGYYLCKPCYW